MMDKKEPHSRCRQTMFLTACPDCCMRSIGMDPDNHGDVERWFDDFGKAVVGMGIQLAAGVVKEMVMSFLKGGVSNGK